MSFESFMLIFGWLAALLFIGVSVYQIVRLVRLPLNVRWEVYPVPHESKEKRQYGGSYMEEMDWATKTRTKSPWPACLEIAAEVLMLRKVKEHNGYGIWPLSLAMHWGLYLYFGWLFLLVVGNLINVAGLDGFTMMVGLAGQILGAAGALGLMLKRAMTRDLHRYTSPLDYFNLVFIAAIFLASFVSWIGDRSFAAHKAYVGGELFFKPVHVPATVSLSFLLFELFVIYMPFTKLIHYVAKYFTFDLALWDDDFKAKGSDVDRRIAAQLGYNVTWAAPHMDPDKTWLQQVQTPSHPENRK